SSSCPLCGGHDTFVHFLVECPSKWQVWNKVLNIHLPTLDLQQTDVLQMLLWRLQPPLPRDLDHLLTVVSTTLWCIWSNYYQKIFSDIPFLPSTIIDKCLSTISLLKASLAT
ncbi:MAG: hypothetical protein EXX96DRAFT_481728, partial [Benjaminiella poitrasii]